MDNLYVKIKTHHKKHECQAVIASFPCLPICGKSNSIESVELFRKLNPKTQAPIVPNQQLLMAEADGMQYSGFDYGEKAPVSIFFTKYIVGVFNKTKNKLQLLDTSYFIMNPQYKKSAEKSKEDNLVESKTNSNQVKDLMKAFGTSKSRRAIDARDKNNIDAGTLETTINNAVENTTIVENLTAEESVGQYMPIGNERATFVGDIYPIENIISANEMDSLRNSIINFEKCTPQILVEWQNKNMYPLYILNHLHKLPMDEEKKSIKIRQLLFLNYMLKLYKIPNHHLRNKNEMAKLNIPKLINSNLLNKFTRKVAGSKSQLTMPTHLRESLLLNILIVCLTLDDYVSELKLLNTTLANGKDLTKYLRQLGCKVGEKVSLSIPFVKPSYIKRPSKRRRT